MSPIYTGLFDQNKGLYWDHIEGRKLAERWVGLTFKRALSICVEEPDLYRALSSKMH